MTARWRPARAEEAGPLRDLQRLADLAGLGEVFPPDRFPFPDDDVLTRWVLVLADEEVSVEVVDGPDGLLAVTAYDATTLRHLAVRPEAWGTGLGRAGVERAVAAGARRLAVLEANHRARRLYELWGWRPTGVTTECPWPPHPVELEYALPA